MKTILCAAILTLAGCNSVPVRPALLDDVGVLLAHPQYGAARRAAPDFTHQALEIVKLRNHELNSK